MRWPFRVVLVAVIGVVFLPGLLADAGHGLPRWASTGIYISAAIALVGWMIASLVTQLRAIGKPQR